MKELNFETGLASYNLNGAVTVTFNPTDPAFVERLFHTFDELDKKQEAYKTEKTADNRELFERSRKWDAEMRAMLDEMLGQPVCDALFGGMNVYAMADGLPVWVNLMFSIMDEIDTAFSREQEAMNPRLTKYRAKYHK